ncbi:MAG TPA: ribonuclease HII [Bacteroidales bacterium]|nr:ribonuclease HII [Bacteroidales bacterium]HPS71573.1 ribonuclease HII [Bacteroidales bacterium]
MGLATSFSNDLTIECGCDEAGRGALVGAVFASAVVLPPDYHNSKLNDSKQLSHKTREQLREQIIKEAISYSVVAVSAEVIDHINILNASIKGMNEAVLKLKIKPELLLIDGNRFKNETNIPYYCIVKGDGKYLSIAAASILAKTFRDDYMTDLDLEFPEYNWKTNKGYPTLEHQEAILKYGRTPFHRKSFHIKNQLKLEF